MRELIDSIPPWVFIAVVVHLVVLGTVAYMILLERKVASWAQDRIGPNRVGLGFGIIPWLKDKKMWGLGQPLADGLKFILKEDYRPAGVDRWLFTLAPMVMIVVVIISIAVIPWGGVHQRTIEVDLTSELAGSGGDLMAAAAEATPVGTAFYGVEPAKTAAGNYLVTYRYPFQIADLNIGALFVLVVLSLAVYGVVIGGWASNNKYSFLGGLRATAQMISYEIPLGLSLLSVVVMTGTLELDQIVNRQAHYWGIHVGGTEVGIPAWNFIPLWPAFLMFLICIHAEANRAPFDLAEAEQELVGGYHTEYSSMRFALFFLAEYAGMITTSAVCVALFFGGWHFPFLGGTVDSNDPSVTTSLLVCVLRAGVLFAKTLVLMFVFMWVRWSLPRFRFDQLMMLAWRALIPMSLALLLVNAVVVYWRLPHDADFLAHRRLNGVSMLVFAAANTAVVAATMLVSRMLPAPPETNRRVGVEGSRFNPRPKMA